LRDKTPPRRSGPIFKDTTMTLFATRSAMPSSGHSLRASLLALAAAAMMVVAAPAGAQNDPLIAKVNGVEIRQSDLAMAEEDLGQNIPPQIQGDAKKDYLVAYLTDLILVAKAAENKKVQDTKEFKARLAYTRNKLLMESILQSEAKAALTPDATKKVYEDAVKQMGDEQEVRARHILVPSEDEAKAILAELKKGTDFAELAKQKSKDPGAAAEGGDLGYFTKEQMVPEFADVAFKLEKGQLSDPVKSQFGWHIIKVEDKRKKPAPDFAQVKDQVETYVQRKAQAEFITKLRESAKVERLDKK
jgi:peptidyl-prolyl cis-trans isomerase C